MSTTPPTTQHAARIDNLTSSTAAFSERLLEFCARFAPQKLRDKRTFSYSPIPSSVSPTVNRSFSASSAGFDMAVLDNGARETAGDGLNAVDVTHVQPKAATEYYGKSDTGSDERALSTAEAREELGGEGPRKKWLSYVKTRDFWVVLVLGQVLALCITGTNTFSSLLAAKGTSIPAFQSFFNYVLLNIIYTSYTWYRYGFKAWGKMVIRDGWRYFILAFLDVEGNYFVVLAYRYTTILSAQLINFWAIVIVVIISLIFLKVRYHIAQYAGIIVCVGGMGVLIASDHITGTNGGTAQNQLKGDLFALAGATFYGLSNVFEEFLVSKRPMYEVVGQLAFWGMLINGTQAGIFDRASFRSAVWDGQVGGYLVGFTLILSLFYTLAPLMFRLSSAAFFNISLLTANFWGVCIGVEVFGYSIHWMYPIAFVLIILGLFTYFATESVMGEAKKPWLGENQEEGVSGVGTAKRRAENPEVLV